MGRYRAQIKILTPEGNWPALELEDAEDFDGTAADYGRQCLDNYLAHVTMDTGEEPEPDTARVLIWDVDDPEMQAGHEDDAVVTIDSPEPAPAEIAVERDREEVLRRRRALEQSIEQLGVSLREARSLGHGANKLAELTYPALSRPIVLEAVRASAPMPADLPSTAKEAEGVWTLGYEMEGSTDAAWVVRWGTGPDTDVYEVNDTLSPDDDEAARKWAAAYLAQAHDDSVQTWEPHRPGPGASPDYWTAVLA